MTRPADSQRSTIPPAAALWLVIALLAGLFPLCAGGDEANFSDGTARYFRELRRRGLFRLAESYCLERLSRSGLSSAQRADLTLELARALAEHATVAGDPEQAELWDRSRSTLAEFLKQEPDNPRRLLLDAQAAILPATIGHTRRWQAELHSFDAAGARRATQSLNEAIESLRALDAKIAERLRKTPASRGAGELRSFEVRALGANVRYRLGSAMLDRASLDPVDSPERAALLLEAQKMLKSVPESGDDAELVWMSRLAFIECSRLLGDPGRTLRELDILDKQSPPPDVADRLLAERVRTLMAQKKFVDAAALLDAEERERNPIPGELAFLQIQLPIAEWQAGNHATAAPFPAKLLETLEERAGRLRRDAGGYWSYRGDLAIQQVREVKDYGAELASLAGRADAAFHSGRSDEAIDLYGEAAAYAHREGRDELAFHFGFTRASVEIKARHWADAAADLLELADQFANNPKTPESHLLAAYALGKLYDEKPTPARREEEYTRVLEEHRTKYSGGPTAPEATWMLAKLDERRGKVTSALELYKSIPRGAKRGPAAQVAVARCFENILDRLRELGEPIEQWQQEAVKTLSPLFSTAPDRAPAEKIADAEVAVRLARILLRARPANFETADKWLVRAAKALEATETPASDRAGAESTSTAAELRALIRQWQVVSLAGQGRFPDARETLHQLSTTSPAELLRILDGIAALQSDDRSDPFHDLGALQLEAALKLSEHRAALSAAEQIHLDECLARSYVASGQTRRGIEIYEKLLDRNAGDKPLLVAYAELLMKCGNKDCLSKALATWQKLEATCQPATAEWFAMRYEVCHTLVLLQETTEACKLLKVTRLVYPKIEDEKRRQKFAELEATCASASGKKVK